MKKKNYLFILILTMICLQHSNTLSTSKQEDNQQDPQIKKIWITDQQIKKILEANRNVTFNNINEKYLFIYDPLLTYCYENIGEDFQSLLDAVLPAGIGAVSMGFAAGAKLAFTAGLWKTGIFGLFKVATATVFSASVLPLAVSVGAATYLYQNYKNGQIKKQCKQIVDEMQEKIIGEQFIKLEEIKDQFYLKLEEMTQKLRKTQETEKNIRAILSTYNSNVKGFQDKFNLFKKYFAILKQLQTTS